MPDHKIAILVYGETASGRDALTEEKYKDLGVAFAAAGFDIRSVLYSDEARESVYNILVQFDAVLVWINPIEQGRDRKNLDELLMKVADAGCMVSAHPEVILKMGTKDVLFKTREMEWSGEVQMYNSFDEFVKQFPGSLEASGVKILKQYRGNGGNGVFKITQSPRGNEVTVIHANKSNESISYAWNEFLEAFKPYFSNSGMLIEQEWNNNHANGMVRCYVCCNKVAGFGYQEINALYELKTGNDIINLPPGKRYYFTENCGLFRDLKEIMETKWIPQLQASQDITTDMLPVIWDADFFINTANSNTAIGKYSLCEINVSSVSPFPPSAIKFIVEEVENRLRK